MVLNVSALQEVCLTVPVQLDSMLSLTEVVQILMNAVQHLDLVDLELCVKTKLVPSAVFVLLVQLVTPTMASVLPIRFSVVEMMTVDQMRSVWSLVSVSVLLHSLLTPQMVESVRVHVKDSSVESMLTVLPPTHHSVSVKLDMVVTQSEDVLMLMSALVTHVVQMPDVSMKMEVTNVNVPRELKETHTLLDVLDHHQEWSVPKMMNAQVNLPVKPPPVLIHALPFLVVTMLSVFQKTMLPGVGAKLDTKTTMESVPQCVRV